MSSLSFLEKAIAFLSPKWACERAGYHEIFRHYEAGEVNRFNDDWMPINDDTENTDKSQRDLIKARARYLERNSDIAAAAVNGIVRNVVGVGIKPQARTESETLNQEIEDLWAEWTKPENCDITGQQSFYELEAMLMRRQIYDGEIFVRKVTDRSAFVPIKLQVIKPDLLSQHLFSAPETNNVIRSGIELDPFLKPLAYWVERKSPDGYITYDPERIPAEQMIHLWNKIQPDQIRGVSQLAPIIKRLKDTQDYLDAETVAARLAACFSIFITSSTGAPGIVGRKKDREGKPLKAIRPGMITYLEPGEEVQTANPSRSTTSAGDFVSTQQRIAGAGLGLSYELMSRDFKKSTFSSARQGQLEDRKTFEPMQEYLSQHFCQKVYEEFLDAAVLAGRLRLPDYWQKRGKYVHAEWITPGWSWIDPEKEVKSDILALANGGMTLAQWCAQRGLDWREQMRQIALEKETAESMGLILPIHTPEAVQAAESNHNQEEGNGKDDEESGNEKQKPDGEQNDT